MKISTTGLVIYEQNIGESDKLITILTEKQGIIRAFVKCAKKLKNINSASTSLLCYSDFMIYQGKDKYIIDEAVAKEVFWDLRNDIEKLVLAQYFCELCITLAPREETSTEFLRLLLNAFYFMTKKNISNTLIKSIVELRLVALSGFMPDVVCCKNCGKYDDKIMYLDELEGNFICKNCEDFISKKNLIPVQSAAMRAMRHIFYSDFEKIFFFDLKKECAKNLAFVSERLILACTNKNFKSLDFYRSLPRI